MSTKILVYIDLLDGAPTSLSREIAAGARTLAGIGGTVDLAVFGRSADAASGLGADRVLTAPELAGQHYNPAVHAAWLERAFAESKPDVVFFGNSTSGIDLAPALAIRHGLPLIGYCTAVRMDGDAIEAESQIYGGKLVATSRGTLPAVAMVNPGAFSEDAGGSRTAEVVALSAPDGADVGAVTFLSATMPDPNAVDITKSDRLLCVGRGIGDEDAIGEAREAAGLMGGELVGSRPIVDAGWLPKERQVGKSGRKVKPRLYLALGVSGAPEHIEGMGTSDLIVAINTDPAAPIFDHAHFGATVDVADFLPAFREALSEKAG
jgi:electron transfer flavoprotein alpha subunit